MSFNVPRLTFLQIRGLHLAAAGSYTGPCGCHGNVLQKPARGKGEGRGKFLPFLISSFFPGFDQNRISCDLLHLLQSCGGWILLETTVLRSSGMMVGCGFDRKGGLIVRENKKIKGEGGGHSICFIGALDCFQCAANFLESPASQGLEITSQLMNK